MCNLAIQLLLNQLAMAIIETHPVQPIVPHDIHFLIVGSFPPIRMTNKVENENGIAAAYYHNQIVGFDHEQDLPFYYGSRDNLFWDLISDVFKEDINTIADIRRFLNERKFGITDIHESVVRIVRKGKISSKDQDFSELVPRQIPIAALSNLQTIFTTSQYVSNIMRERHPNLGVSIVTIISPSPNGSRAIGRSNDYKQMKIHGVVTNTYEYRLLKYTEAFQNVGLTG